MKKNWFALGLCVAILSGCSYNESEMMKSQAACAARDGQFQTGTTSDGVVFLTYCVFGGYRYTFNRDTGVYYGAERL